MPKVFIRIAPYIKYIVLFLLVVLPLLGFYLGMGFNKQMSGVSSKPGKVESPTPLPTNMAPLQSEDYKTPNPVKTQIDMSKNLFFNFPYPAEVKTIPQSQLVEMKCTHNFLVGNMYGGRSKYIYSEAVDAFTPVNVKNDTPIDSLRYEIFQATGINPIAFMYCQADKNDYYIFKDQDAAYFAKYDFERKKIVVFSSISAVFMTCNPIELTTSGVFYFVCKGGDTASHTQLYKIDSSAPSVQPFVNCSTDTPGLNPRPPFMYLQIKSPLKNTLESRHPCQ